MLRAVPEICQGTDAIRKAHFQLPGGLVQTGGYGDADRTLARNMVHKAAWLKDNGLPHLVECAYAKLFSSEMCEKCASDAVEIHGGYGLMKEYPVSRYWAQCKLLQIVQGTSEIQRVVIGRNLSL